MAEFPCDVIAPGPHGMEAISARGPGLGRDSAIMKNSTFRHKPSVSMDTSGGYKLIEDKSAESDLKIAFVLFVFSFFNSVVHVPSSGHSTP